MSTAPVEALAFKPGIYPGMSYEDYEAIPAIRHSTLEGFVPPKTPAHGRELMLHPKDQTEAMSGGSALHVAVLEPERYELEYIVAPRYDKRTKLGKLGWADFEAANRGKNLVMAEEDEQFRAMRDSVLAHPMAREFIAGAVARELTIVWQDPKTGLLCKARLDMVSGYASCSWILDLKRARDASERGFQGAVARFGYARQTSWYRTGLDILRPAPRRVAFIAVEPERPYAVACYELDESALEQGERENAAALETFRRCQESGIYPGYDAGLGLISLPAWAMDAMELSDR